jgi:hypothetical protein
MSMGMTEKFSTKWYYDNAQNHYDLGLQATGILMSMVKG